MSLKQPNDDPSIQLDDEENHEIIPPPSTAYEPPSSNNRGVDSNNNDSTVSHKFASLKNPSAHISAFDIEDWQQSSIIDADYQMPCPRLSKRCPNRVILFCCCFWTHSDRKQCAIELIYTKYYKFIYVLIIAMTLVLLIYDIASGNMWKFSFTDEPIWFLLLDIVVMLLMVTDLVLQIQANFDTFWRSKWNIADFAIVIFCILTIPLYLIVPDFVLTLVILFRFASRLLRMVVVYKHEKFRKEYMSARDAIIDFSGFDHIRSFKDNFDPGHKLEADNSNENNQYLDYDYESQSNEDNDSQLYQNFENQQQQQR